MNCLKPGGVAVHTTEFNVSSNTSTAATGETVFVPPPGHRGLCEAVEKDGHKIDVDFSPGTAPADNFVDLPPYAHATHLKLQTDKFVASD